MWLYASAFFYTPARSGACERTCSADFVAFITLRANHVPDLHRSNYSPPYINEQPPRSTWYLTFRNLLPPQTTSLGRSRLPYAAQSLAAYAPYGVGGQPPPPWLPPNDVGSDAQKGPQQQWPTDRLRGLAPTRRRQMHVATILWGVS